MFRLDVVNIKNKVSFMSLLCFFYNESKAVYSNKPRRKHELKNNPGVRDVFYSR